jgi:hypothetical protein
MQEMVMVVPVDPDVDKTHHIACEDGYQWSQSSQACVMRSAQLEHHNGDDDGDNAITERFHAASGHESLFFPADGEETLRRAHVHHTIR